MKKISIKGPTWDSAFLALSKALSLLFSILSAKILSTGLTLSGYGTYAQANIIMMSGTSIILCGLGDALAYYFNKNDKSIDESLKQRIINTVFFIEIVLGAILAVVILLGKNLIADYFSNPMIIGLLPVVAVLPVFSNVIYFLKVMYISLGRAKWMTVLNLLLTVIRIIAVYVAVYILKDILWIYMTILIMDIVQVSIYNINLRKKSVRINPIKISFKHIKPIIVYGLPMGIYALTNEFTRELDKLVIGRLGGTEQLAIYSNCSKILPLDFFVTSFALVLIPYIYRRVSEGKRQESIDLFSSYLKVGYYTVWTLGVMVLVAPKSIISFLYADAYTEGLGVFVLYIIDSMLRFASVHLILTAAGKSRSVMTYSLVSLGLNLVLNIAFYYLWGMIGPAIATLIVAFVYTFLILRATNKTIGAKWTEVFDIKDMILFVISLMAIWVVAFILNIILLRSGLHIYIAMFISMAFFGLIALALHYKKIFGVLKKINSFKL